MKIELSSISLQTQKLLYKELLYSVVNNLVIFIHSATGIQCESNTL